ncbi:LysR family transcriptional regulator [Mycolicibacterium sp. P1-18]|uniref:LysR family transcriptional regulator n=1 Tax=Mycolicibacterium sp. P1-18 TaxID=2024615 RepID=UPI0011F0B731|nr:LysR family transcriptional regulator [Mycolicibacterium sp. P1-18]KAA0093561.1 LysR family transcriptional regulator [Mycolicibacterium sp. P1-18]
MTEAVALDDVAVFLAVAECQSFVGAARRLGMPQSSVSRRVAALENQVGTSLLRRTTRSLSVTSEGQRLVEACALPVAQIRAALDDIALAASGASDSLSIAVNPYICPEEFRTWVSDFGEERPDITLNLTVNGNAANFVADGIDLAIQLGPPQQRSLVSVKLYDVPFRLVVSQELLRQNPRLGELRDPEQLHEHVCAVVLPITGWCFASHDGEERQVTPTKLAAASNDPWVVVDAVRRGRGVGFMPEALVDDRIVSIDIAGWTPVPSSVHAVFPQRLRNTPKVRSAVESVRRRGSGNGNSNFGRASSSVSGALVD